MFPSAFTFNHIIPPVYMKRLYITLFRNQHDRTGTILILIVDFVADNICFKQQDYDNSIRTNEEQVSLEHKNHPIHEGSVLLFNNKDEIPNYISTESNIDNFEIDQFFTSIDIYNQKERSLCRLDGSETQYEYANKPKNLDNLDQYHQAYLVTNYAQDGKTNGKTIVQDIIDTGTLALFYFVMEIVFSLVAQAAHSKHCILND